MARGRRHRHAHRRHFHRQTPPGAPPGTVRADPAARPPVVHVLAYGPDQFVERQLDRLSDLPALRAASDVVWVNVEGLGDALVVQELGRQFDLHPLALEDVVHVHQRPKVDDYDAHLYVVVRMPTLRERIDTEQVSLFLGDRFVVTFLEDPGDCFEPVRQRLRTGSGRIRALGADYLAYALLDALIDSYFPLLENYGDRLDALETRVVEQPRPALIREIHATKHDLRLLRRATWPLRESLYRLTREDSPLIRPETRIFLRDCHDHAIQILDLVETYRELGADLTDVFLSSQGNRLNEVMKVLTIISTIFIPLSFVASLYGMNFDYADSHWNMPELHSRYGYPMVLGVMGLMVLGMLVFFYRRGWIGQDDFRVPPPAPVEPPGTNGDPPGDGTGPG